MKVLVFGSLNYDFVYSVDHIIVPGETQFTYETKTYCGGKGLNQAIAISRAGVPVYMAGQVGEDGQELIDICHENKVDTTYLKQVEGRSGHTIIQVDKDAQNCILLFGGSNRSMTKEYIDEVLDDFSEGDILILQNEINELSYVIDKAYERKMRIMLNPSPFDSLLDECDMSKISIFMLNEIEGGQISGETEADAILDKMRAKFPEAEIVLTLGGDGAVYDSPKERCHQGIYKVKAVDTTAAGDTFTGYFIAGLVAGKPIPEVLDRCAKASSITVSRPGATASIPFADEII